MKTKYKYIQFVKPDYENEWECLNNRSKDVLATVIWYKDWKQWVAVFTNPHSVFSYDCLLDIADFVKQLNEGKP